MPIQIVEMHIRTFGLFLSALWVSDPHLSTPETFSIMYLEAMCFPIGLTFFLYPVAMLVDLQ